MNWKSDRRGSATSLEAVYSAKRGGSMQQTTFGYYETRQPYIIRE
jgi:hypothetical protein